MYQTYKISKKFTPPVSSIKKLLEHVLHQHKEITEEKGKLSRKQATQQGREAKAIFSEMVKKRTKTVGL